MKEEEDEARKEQERKGVRKDDKRKEGEVLLHLSFFLCVLRKLRGRSPPPPPWVVEDKYLVFKFGEDPVHERMEGEFTDFCQRRKQHCHRSPLPGVTHSFYELGFCQKPEVKETPSRDSPTQYFL